MTAPSNPVADTFRAAHDSAGTFAREVHSKLSEQESRGDSLHRNARVIVETALRDYGGPCSQAYADVLRAYIAAPEGGRDALFLELAYRAVGKPERAGEGVTPSPSPCSGSPAISAPAPPQASDPAVDAFLRGLLSLLRPLQPQAAGEPTDAPR